MILETVLTLVPAVTATVGVVQAFARWWQSRTWSSLDQGRKLLIELSQTENVHITKRAKEDAEKAAAVLTLELGTRAQRRAKKVANRNTAAQEKLKTTGKSLFLIGVATICVWGVYGTATGTLTDVIRMPAPLAYLYFVVLGTTGAFGSVHVWFELGSLLQNRSQAHELYKSVVARPALKHMTDDE